MPDHSKPVRWSAPGESKRGPRLLSSAPGDLAQLDADDGGRASCKSAQDHAGGAGSPAAEPLRWRRRSCSSAAWAVRASRIPMRAAGAGASQVHHFFGYKQSLAEAVIVYDTDAVLGTVRPRLGQSDSMDALRAWRGLLVETRRDRHCDGGCPLGSLVPELAESLVLALDGPARPGGCCFTRM